MPPSDGEIDAALFAALDSALTETDSFDDRFAAEVWLLDMSRRLERRIEDPEERMSFLKLLHAEAQRAELAPELVLALIETESAFDPWALSSAGARGLMQIMPFWKDEIGRVDDNLFHPATNLRYGCTILRHYLDREQNELRPALQRYNGAIGSRKYSDKVFHSLRQRWYKQ